MRIFKNIINFNLLYLFIIFLLIVLTFRQLPQTFYQQDEWLGSGQVMALGFNVVTQNSTLASLLFGDGRPLARFLGVVFVKSFGLNTVPLAIYSIIFHFLNSSLVFLIALKLFRKHISAFISASFFALNSVSHQAITWYAASFGVLPAVFFILFSIYAYLLFLERERKVFIYISFLSAIISLYFKEIGIFLFVFLPLISYLFKKNFSFLKILKTHILLIVTASIFVFYRLMKMLLFGGPSNAGVFLTTATGNIFLILFSRILLYPLTSFSLIFIPYPISTAMAFGLTHIYYPYIPKIITSRSDLVTFTSILDLIGIVLSFILFISLFFIYVKRKELRKVIQFALLLFFLSIMPYVVVAKEYAYMEPRYYYLTSAASGMIIAIFFTFMFKSSMKKILILFLIVLLFLGYLKYQVKIIRMDIAKQVTITTERKAFLNTLNSYLPTLKSNTNVFYFTGNESWLVDGNMTPFQHGFGYSVMVIYYQSGKIPKELLASNDEFLFALGEQGYRSIDGLNFGYFNKYEDLKQTVIKERIKVSDVHAFYYDRKEKKLVDISYVIRNELEKDL